MIAGVERGIAEVFAALEQWFVSSGATQSMLRFAWAVLTVVWLGYVAMLTRPGGHPDLIDAFGRLIIAGGLLTGIGSLTRTIVLGFDTFRSAGAAVLQGLIVQNWTQFMQDFLAPVMHRTFSLLGLWFTYPWAIGVLLAGLALAVLLFAVGVMVYLAILFFAHLTLLLAIFVAPLAVALLAAPATQRWTARWVIVIVRTSFVVFSVRVIHAAVIYIAVIVPIREVSSGFQNGFEQLGGSGGIAALGLVLLNLAMLLFLMLVGTGVGVYAMLRAERLTTQFVEGVTMGENVFGGPLWLRGQIAAWYGRGGGDYSDPNVASGGGAGLPGPWGEPGGSGGGAQEATVMKSGGRLHR